VTEYKNAASHPTASQHKDTLVGVFASCPVDLFRPSVGESVVEVLVDAGFNVDVPPQSCCGQVGYNNGDEKLTTKVALDMAKTFSPYDYVVVPSGSCGGMLKHHYLDLFKKDSADYLMVKKFSDKVYEFTTFVHDIIGLDNVQPKCDLSDKTVTYHDSCAGLREMNISKQPRALLKKMANVDVTEMPDTNVCCGFGGTFCVKYTDISTKMVSNKLDNARSVNAQILTGGDVSCLLNIAGRAQRQGDADASAKIEVRHVAELLTGKLDTPAIGEAKK